ncbi:sodium channel protein Nach-like [Colletes latitarsis]|uniref:sodium channel protein Nach-like n=1 Tax=Colletes latitarsis TaxID=2605962 RepID=UPI00403667A1
MFSQLGNLYDSEFRITERSYQIDQLLAEFYKGSYDVTDILKRLTPQCSNVISRCRFHGENKNCSKVFETRKTQDGFCCTFNYAIKKDDRSLNNGVDLRLDPLKVENFGEDQGLSVLLEPLLDDYFYPIFPITGWKVMVFNPHDYPDMNSGGLIEIFVPLETYQNVELDAIVSYGTRNILPYSLEHRKCVFPEEMTSPNASYTYSDCLVDCTIQDVWQTCKCIPFYLPNHVKWYTAVPNADLRDVKNNTQILHCNRCYPLCSGVTYNAKTFEARLNRGRHQSKLLDGVDCVQQSAVHLYFNHFGTIKLKQNVVDQWYELLSDASGIGGIFIGFSLIAIVEFGYFVGLFVWELLKGPTSSDGIDNKTKRKRPALQIIYWGELYPRTRPDIITNQHGRFPNKY